VEIKCLYKVKYIRCLKIINGYLLRLPITILTYKEIRWLQNRQVFKGLIIYKVAYNVGTFYQPFINGLV